MKATELLQKQHRDIEALLDRLRGAGQGEEKAIREQLAENLVAHTVIEQEFFYPAVRESMPEEILEAIEEHGLADFQLARLLHAKPGDPLFEAKDSVLAEVVIRHIRKEETDVFRAAEREVGEDMLHQLGERMQARFRQVIEQGYLKLLQRALVENLPPVITRAIIAKKAPATRAAVKQTKQGVRAKRGAAQARRAPTKRRKPAAKQAATQQVTRKAHKQSGRRVQAQRAQAQRSRA